MPGTVTLSSPEAVECDGVLYVIGQREGTYLIRRSADAGATWLPFSDGSSEKAVAPAQTDQRAALVKLNAQGRPLLACIPEWPDLVVYVSHDDGETWEQESAV